MLHNRTKSITLLFERNNILYDVENYAYVEGDIMPDESGNAKHQVMDIGQDGNVDRVTRVLDLAYAECVEFMYPYTKMPSKDGSMLGNDFQETSTYVIEMTVDEGLSQTTINLISKLVHEYMVCRVLGDWLSITKPERQSNWDNKAENIKNQIRVRLNARHRRVRRALSPF